MGLATLSTPAFAVVTASKSSNDITITGTSAKSYSADRTYQELEDLPVIFVTGEGDVEMVSRGAAMGGIDYVTKPIQQEVLLALVRSRLSHL